MESALSCGAIVGRRPKTGLRETILVLLWQVQSITHGRGALGQRQIARWLDEPANTVRNHLLGLSDEGLVAFDPVTSEVALTPAGRAAAAAVPVSVRNAPQRD